MKKILAVYDREDAYGKKLAESLNRKESTPFSLFYFTKEEALIEFAREHEVDFLLLEEGAESDEIRSLGILKTAFLTRRQETEKNAKERYVYKYQPSDTMVRELLACYEAERTGKKEAAAFHSSVTAAGIYSPIARCQKTAFALTLGQILAKSQTVLYMNTDEFSGLEAMTGKSFAKDLSDAAVSAAGGNLKKELSELTEHWHGMDILPSARYPEDLHCMGAETLSGLLKEIGESGQYDVILLDLGCRAEMAAGILGQCQKIFMPILEDPVSQEKLWAYENWMQTTGKGDVLQRTEKLKLPYKKSQLAGELYLEQLLWGDFGEYVRSVVRATWQQ